MNIEIIDFENLQFIYVASKPPRLEAKIVFDRDNISQKLIFEIMEITHRHGFGCSPPSFNGPDGPEMIFLVGTILPSKKSVNKYSALLKDCIDEIYFFMDNFSKQLDFSRLDLSMFNGIAPENFNPERIAAIRDQHYDGNWDNFCKAMKKQDKKEEADIVERCKKFEESNKKDIGFVGHQLEYMLHLFFGEQRGN